MSAAIAAPTAAQPGTYRTFFDQLLLTLGITPTPGAEAGLADVVHEEGANSYNNPFNIEYHAGQNSAWKGSGSFNSVGVQEYATPAAGLAATASFLNDNPRYGPLLAALKTGSTPTIQHALTAEYTWAPFHTASAAQEQAILSQATGTAASVTPVAAAVGSGAASGVATAQPTDFFGIGSAVKDVVYTGVFVAAGLGIVGLGVFRASAPARQKITGAAEKLAPLAAAA